MPNEDKTKQYVFGPVPSRRLGRSLGIDLVPYKTCSYNCIYCQLGKTTNLTVEQKEWVSPAKIISELKEKLHIKPDYITLSGSGEPTLYAPLEELIGEIKKITGIPVAVLTNGSLLWKKDVRKALLNADLVIPSLDAANEYFFQYVNRPHHELSFDLMVSGLKSFREEYSGQYWLEIFLLGGVTGIEGEVRKLVNLTEEISPDRIQLNTVVRPPAEEYAFMVQQNKMEYFAGLFNQAEVISHSGNMGHEKNFEARQEDVLALLKRRPCSMEDISCGLGMHRNEAVKYIEELLRNNQIISVKLNGKVFYEKG